jgi:hypothetical protein
MTEYFSISSIFKSLSIMTVVVFMQMKSVAVGQENYSQLMQAGTNGVFTGCDSLTQTKIMIQQDFVLDLRRALFFMEKEHKKPIILVETAYCSVPTEYKKKSGPFPETPIGQKEFLEEVNKIVPDIPDNLVQQFSGGNRPV